MRNNSGLQSGDDWGYHDEYHPWIIIHAGMSLRMIWLRWWVSMGGVNMYTTIKLYRTIRGPVWKTTSILDLVWKQLGIGDFILNKTSMSSCLTEGWICANGYPWAKQQTTVYEYVCARETAGKGSWLRQKSSMLLMHERLAIKEKGWRGMYSCSDGVACRGVNTIWYKVLHAGLGCITLLETRKTPATPTSTIEYPWPTLESILWKYPVIKWAMRSIKFKKS